MIFKPIIKKKPKNPLSLREYYQRRNKVLIKRLVGGFGDIIVQRMMFEDFYKQFPNLEFTFSCPHKFIDLAINHPFVKTIEIEKLEENDFGIVYDISTACRTHELRYASNNKKNRSDIWAEYCGITLKNHNQFLKPKENMVLKCKEMLSKYNTKNLPVVLLATQSTNDNYGNAKSLNYDQVFEIIKELKKMGFYVFTIHSELQDAYSDLQVDQFVSININQWVALVSIADYVISIDSATFHIAGALKKPLVGIFSFTDGKVVGKYYDFILVQKHKDNGNWDCGPCWNFYNCPKSSLCQKPCITELLPNDAIQALQSIVYKSSEKFINS
jgi:ADP-heptose:LPS heptosyltransferase